MIENLQSAEDIITSCESYLISGDYDLARAASIPAFDYIAAHGSVMSKRSLRFLGLLIAAKSECATHAEIVAALTAE
jgi:hypothetical protein